MTCRIVQGAIVACAVAAAAAPANAMATYVYDVSRMLPTSTLLCPFVECDLLLFGGDSDQVGVGREDSVFIPGPGGYLPGNGFNPVTVNGFIATDALGDIDETNIIDWSITIKAPAVIFIGPPEFFFAEAETRDLGEGGLFETATLTPSDSNWSLSGGGMLTATQEALTFAGPIGSELSVSGPEGSWEFEAISSFVGINSLVEPRNGPLSFIEERATVGRTQSGSIAVLAPNIEVGRRADVPLPAAGVLLIGALGAVAGVARRKRAV